MTEFETLMMCLLIPLYGIMFYVAGKGDFFNLVVRMLQEKLKEIEERLRTEDGN